MIEKDSTPVDRLGREFWTLTAASGLSNLADGVFRIGLPLVAIRYTRSPALVAGLELVWSAPWLIASLHVGALVDRLDRRTVMLRANTLRLTLVAAAALTLSAGAGSLWLLYFVALGTGFAEVFYDTAAQSILPSVVPRSLLDRANGRLGAVELGMQQFAGPPLGGALIFVALALPLATSAALWVVAVAVLVTLRGQFQPSLVGPRTSIVSDIGEGFSFLVGQPVLRNMAIMVGMGNLAASAMGAVLVLFVVGPDSPMGLTEPEFGLFFALIAGGGLLGAMSAERVQARLGRANTLTVSVLGMIPWVAIPALTTDVIAIGVALFLGGATMMLWNVISVSFRQRITPDHLLGRVNSSYRLLAWGTRPIGAALGGAIGQWFGLRSVFAVMGIVMAAVLIPNRAITEQSLSDAELGVP